MAFVASDPEVQFQSIPAQHQGSTLAPQVIVKLRCRSRGCAGQVEEEVACAVGSVTVASEGAPFDIDLLAASLRADTSDIGAFVDGLVAKLEEVLPGRVKVQRGRRGMFGPKVVQRVGVELGDARLELLRGGGDAIETRRARMSGGIVLKSEPLDMDTWLAALGGAITTEAQRSEQTRQALERLLTQ